MTFVWSVGEGKVVEEGRRERRGRERQRKKGWKKGHGNKNWASGEKKESLVG